MAVLDSKKKEVQKEVALSQSLLLSTTSSAAACSSNANGEHAVISVAEEDSDDGDDECFARTQIKNLQWIETSDRHKKALEFWETQDALCTRRVDSKRKQSLAVKNEVYQLVGFYSVFQGVLLTAVSQSNLLHCNNWWSAFSLSALAAFVTVIGVIQKFRTVWKLERTIASEKESRQIFVVRAGKLRNKGPDFRFHKDAKDGKFNAVDSKRSISSYKLEGSIVAVIFMLIVFSGTFLASIQRILCNPGDSKLPPPGP